MPAASYPVSSPMRQSGSLDRFEQKISNPAIGLEFPNIDLVDIMDAPNADEMLRDLAIMIAERGVVIFRDQKRLDNAKHREFIDRVSKLGGRPSENGIMKHALHQIYGDDSEVASLTPERLMMRFGFGGASSAKRQNHALDWHRDMAFEHDPAALSSLRVEQLPVAGGDTMWASSYEMYDRLSKPIQQLLESLTCTWQDSDVSRIPDRPGVYTGPRGSPNNVGFGKEQVHPAVRTHPITGFKALYAAGTHCQTFNDVTPEENEMLMGMLQRLLTCNHDLQTRFGWQNPGDIAVWDNRCVMHCATMDVVGKRLGFRVLSAGEKPYLDPESTGRADAMQTMKALYDAKVEKVKESGWKEVDGKYENGKQVNGHGKLGVNPFDAKTLLSASNKGIVA